MKKSLFLIILILILPTVFAHIGEEDTKTEELAEAKALIDSKISCDKLTNDQLEIIGEYMMEQMHPGEAHEQMHASMDIEEGTEAEEEFHINIAKSMYCQQGGMMNMAMGENMMGNNIMYGGFGALGFLWMLLGLVLFVGAAILIWLLVIKFWKELKKR